MSTQETWRFINSFAPWLSALGTIAAVVTSLYLARRGDRIALDVRAGIRTLAVQGAGGDHGTDMVWVNVTNLGRRPATLTHLVWRPLPWRKAGLIGIAPSNQYCSDFPVTLGDGDSANYAMPMDDFRHAFRNSAADTFKGISGWLRLAFLRFSVTTSAGHSFDTVPERELKRFLRQIATEE